MLIIERNRTIRPSTRESSSKYRVNLENVQTNDIIRINIDHETKPFQESYTIAAKSLMGKKNLYFNVQENGKDISIVWAGDVIPTKI